MIRLLVLLTSLLVPALLCAQDGFDSPRGTREIGASGTVFVSYDSPEDLFGVVTGRFGIYAARNHQFGVDSTVFAYSRIQDIYLSGYYRYSLARPERRLAPYVGGAVGANVAHFDYFGTERALIVKVQAGVRYFLTGSVSFDIGYDLMWRRQTDYSFTGKTSSVLTFGFAKRF